MLKHGLRSTPLYNPTQDFFLFSCGGTIFNIDFMLLFWRSWAALTRRSRRFEAGKGHGGFITRGCKVVTPILSLHQNWLCQDLWWFTMIYTISIVYIYIYSFYFIYLFIYWFLYYTVFIFCLFRGGITGVASPSRLPQYYECHGHGCRVQPPAFVQLVGEDGHGGSIHWLDPVFDMFWKIAGWLH